MREREGEKNPKTDQTRPDQSKAKQSKAKQTQPKHHSDDLTFSPPTKQKDPCCSLHTSRRCNTLHICQLYFFSLQTHHPLLVTPGVNRPLHLYPIAASARRSVAMTPLMHHTARRIASAISSRGHGHTSLAPLLWAGAAKFGSGSKEVGG